MSGPWGKSRGAPWRPLALQHWVAPGVQGRVQSRASLQAGRGGGPWAELRVGRWTGGGQTWAGQGWVRRLGESPRTGNFRPGGSLLPAAPGRWMWQGTRKWGLPSSPVCCVDSPTVPASQGVVCPHTTLGCGDRKWPLGRLRPPPPTPQHWAGLLSQPPGAVPQRLGPCHWWGKL